MKRILTLGESMARMSTQPGYRLSDSTQLRLHYGGAEANVAMNLSLLGHDVKYASKLPSNNGLANSLIAQLKGYGVDCQHVLFGEGRLGSYYLEVGSGLRASHVIYDRYYSTISLMKETEWDLDELFADVSIFHITGITLALSEKWHQMGIELIKEAKKRGIIVSFDMNFRSKMWSQEVAKKVFQQLLPYVDYLSAGKLDAIHFMDIPEKEDSEWSYYAEEMAKVFPNIRYIYGTIRVSLTPNSYNMYGYIYDSKSQVARLSRLHANHTVVDRVGSGDSYTAAVLDGIIHGKALDEIVAFGMAASALKHTVYGDVNPFSREEIQFFMSNASDVVR